MIGSYRQCSASDLSKHLTLHISSVPHCCHGDRKGPFCSHLTYGKWSKGGAKEALGHIIQELVRSRPTGLLRPTFTVFNSKYRSYNKILNYGTEAHYQSF